MKNISILLSVVLLGLLLAGCASQPSAPKPADSRIEAPAQSGSDVEVHGEISTSVGTTIK